MLLWELERFLCLLKIQKKRTLGVRITDEMSTIRLGRIQTNGRTLKIKVLKAQTDGLLLKFLGTDKRSKRT